MTASGPDDGQLPRRIRVALAPLESGGFLAMVRVEPGPGANGAPAAVYYGLVGSADEARLLARRIAHEHGLADPFPPDGGPSGNGA